MLITHKLGYKLAYEMSLPDLYKLVSAAQQKRSIDRAIARSNKIDSDNKTTKNKAKRASRSVNLTTLGLTPESIAMLTAAWPLKTDAELMDMLRGLKAFK